MIFLHLNRAVNERCPETQQLLKTFRQVGYKFARTDLYPFPNSSVHEPIIEYQNEKFQLDSKEMIGLASEDGMTLTDVAKLQKIGNSHADTLRTGTSPGSLKKILR